MGSTLDLAADSRRLSDVEPRARSRPAAVALVVVVTVVVSAVLSLLGLPSAVLFGALVGGMAHALTSATELEVPAVAFRVGQALIGITIGTTVSLAALRAIGRRRRAARGSSPSAPSW